MTKQQKSEFESLIEEALEMAKDLPIEHTVWKSWNLDTEFIPFRNPVYVTLEIAYSLVPTEKVSPERLEQIAYQLVDILMYEHALKFYKESSALKWNKTSELLRFNRKIIQNYEWEKLFQDCCNQEESTRVYNKEPKLSEIKLNPIGLQLNKEFLRVTGLELHPKEYLGITSGLEYFPDIVLADLVRRTKISEYQSLLRTIIELMGENILEPVVVSAEVFGNTAFMKYARHLKKTVDKIKSKEHIKEYGNHERLFKELDKMESEGCGFSPFD